MIRNIKQKIASLRNQSASDHATLIASGRLVIGEHSYGTPRVVVFEGDDSRVVVGRYCSIGADVEIMPGGGHHTNWVTTFPIRARFGLPGAFDDGHPTSKGDVTIGHDVWIGRGARILSGVTVGNGAVIGAYSVVTKDVAPYTIVAGAPAVVIRQRFSPATVEALQALAWWNWPTERVIENVDLLCGEDLGWISGQSSNDA